MSLMSFMKEAGEKLFGGGTAQAATPASNPDAANQAAADAIVTYIRAQNLDAENLSVKFDGASSAVTVSGQASDQETKEKILLCCGNVAHAVAPRQDLPGTEAAHSAAVILTAAVMPRGRQIRPPGLSQAAS